VLAHFRHGSALINGGKHINEVAYNLCDANESVQARKFAKLTLKRSEVWSSPEGILTIFALFSVSSEDPTFIKQVFAKYMDSFPDYLKRAGDGYFSPADFPPDISIQPTDWTVEVNHNPHGSQLAAVYPINLLPQRKSTHNRLVAGSNPIGQVRM
jgi:hypothetical protein